jgi:hypothetical protein
VSDHHCLSARNSDQEYEAIYQELVEAGLDDEARRDPDFIEAVFKKLNAADEAEQGAISAAEVQTTLTVPTRQNSRAGNSRPTLRSTLRSSVMRPQRHYLAPALREAQGRGEVPGSPIISVQERRRCGRRSPPTSSASSLASGGIGSRGPVRHGGWVQIALQPKNRAPRIQVYS